MKNVKWKNILQLQAVVIIYTISSVMAKTASRHKEERLLFLLFFGLEFILLGIYALLWQQMIKKFELSVAYANRAMAILWSMIWAVLFFWWVLYWSIQIRRQNNDQSVFGSNVP